MDTLVSYLIKSVSISGLLLLYYGLVLRNRRFHSFNRVYLLSVLLASLVLPLVRFSWLRIPWLRLHTAGREPLEGLITGIGLHPATAAHFPVAGIVLALCVVVSVVFLLVLAARIFAVFRLKWHHTSQRIEGCHFIEIKDRRAPFSFLNNLFWQKGSDIDDPMHRKIFAHELAHIRGRHTYDSLFAQFLAGIFWMNPFYWLIRQELTMVHEFIADDVSIEAGDTESFARMLLQGYDEGRYLDPSHRFFHSPIKRRLVMISSSQRPSRYTFRKMLTVPALLAVMVFSCSKEQNVAPEKPQVGPPTVMILKGKLNFSTDTLKLALNSAVKKIVIENVRLYSKNGKIETVNLWIDTSRVKMQQEPMLERVVIPDSKPE